MNTRKLIILFALVAVMFSTIPLIAVEQNDLTQWQQGIEKELTEAKAKEEKLRAETDLLWTLIAAFLVFLMQAGFAYVESGFIRSKNVVNILMKNLSDMSVGSLAYWLLGFSIMFGPHLLDGIGFGVPVDIEKALFSEDNKPIASNYGFFMFQLVFAATAATIVSGAMAERTRFYVYLVASVITTAFIYPVFGSFAWSNLFDSENVGFLAQRGFIDFAGSTVVHSIGGWIGLAGAIILGPRIGKYGEDGSIKPIFGHNMSMATLGVFLLWFGWFGFNPGSTTSVGDGSFAIIAVTTNIAAAAGGVGAMILSWILFKRPDITMVLNGILAGLVAITAPCYNVSISAAAIIGLIAGLIVVVSVIALDHLHIDDPVGAVSVHGVAGAWGTLSVGLFANPAFGDGAAGLFYSGSAKLLGVQALGVITAFAWAFGSGLIMFTILKKTIGLRVSKEEEIEGLDILEHGNEAYPLEN